MKGLEIEIERTTRGRKKKGVRECLSPIPENPLNIEEDYADPDKVEMKKYYHVLEGSTPEGEEEREREIKLRGRKGEREGEREN